MARVRQPRARWWGRLPRRSDKARAPLVPSYLVVSRVLIVALLAAAGAGPALAQSQADIAAARKAYRKGEQAFQAGRYDEALQEFERGYELSKKELFLLNIGYAHEQLGNHAQALDFYQRYRATSPPAEELPDLDARIRVMQAELDARRPPPPPPPPEPVVVAPPPEAQLAQPAAAPPTPIYGRWYFWAGVGAAVAAGVVIGVLAASSGGPEYQDRGTWGSVPRGGWGGL